MENKEYYIVSIGTLMGENECYYDLRQSGITNVLFENYLSCQKYLFNLVSEYSNFQDRIYAQRIIITLEIHKSFNFVNIYSGSYYDRFIYYYGGICKEGQSIALRYPPREQPDFERFSYNNRIEHYIPKEKENEYKQALMEYRLGGLR